MLDSIKNKIKNKVKTGVKKFLLSKFGIILVVAMLAIVAIIMFIVVIIDDDEEYEDYAAIEKAMNEYYVMDYDPSIDPDSLQGKFHKRVVDNAIVAREAGIRIKAGIIGSTYYYINYYYNDFEYEDMTDEIINDLIYNMVSSRTVLTCRERSTTDLFDMPDEIARCYQIILTDYDPEGNPATPAEIAICQAIIENYERTKANEEDLDEKVLTFEEGQTPACPPNYNIVNRRTLYSLDMPKYFKYLKETFIPTVAPDLEEEEILEIVEKVETVEERFFEAYGIPEYFFSADEAYIPLEVAEEFSPPFKTPYKITSWFGSRIHPITKKIHFHAGIDISGPGFLGKKIYAPASGVVATVGFDKSCGNKVILRHNIKGTTYETIYCHLYKIYVSVGSSSNPNYIEKGEPIGEVGSTGSSTGPHLHWGVWEGRYGSGKKVDPFYLIKADPNCYYGSSSNPTSCSSK